MTTNSNKALTAGLIALTVAGAAVLTNSEAEARNNFARGLGAGLAGAAIGGALVAGLNASDRAPAYSYAPAYAPQPAYIPNPYYQPVCRVVWRENAWGDMYRAQVCR
ncbi:hypothetical protein JNB88_24850 [Rhizobium cauense]|uniref:hypothetical protein n=1 Tax=Rhizobium cauense TaxID=1166683 RepID=UPI001C6EE886|nr:hypothetical protein [Rhizobium cauense]MBW9116860.1 hypothetical protein [Rhizobium cauense]